MEMLLGLSPDMFYKVKNTTHCIIVFCSQNIQNWMQYINICEVANMKESLIFLLWKISVWIIVYFKLDIAYLDIIKFPNSVIPLLQIKYSVENFPRWKSFPKDAILYNKS